MCWNRPLAPGAHLLRLSGAAGFLPGQNVSLTTELRIPPRSYSIVSAPAEPWTEVLFTVVPDGAMTPRLASLGAGEAVYVSDPFGAFTDVEGPAWWIAGGAGIAPFLSMVRAGRGRGKVLVHGSRSVEGLYLSAYLRQQLGPAYRPCCSAEGGQGVARAHLVDYLAGLELPADVAYLLCGRAEMVVAVRDVLIGKGVPFGNIIAEIFF